MELNENEKYLIIASNEYAHMFYSYREKNPSFNFKVINKIELCDLLAFSFIKDPIPFLLKKLKWDYSQCKKILNILRIGEYSNGLFKDLYDELELSGYIKKDTLGERKVKSSKVLIFENDEDFELKELLKRKGISYESLYFSDLGINDKFEESKPCVLEFDDKMRQYFYIFSDIKAKILADDKVKDHITIFTETGGDIFYMNLFMNIFNMDCLIQVKTPINATREVSEALVKFYKNKNFVLDYIPKKDSPISQVIDIINTYELESLPFDFAYSCLVEITSSLNSVYKVTMKGISLTDRIDFGYVLDENSLIYISSFQHDVFYKEYADDNVISDAELEDVKVNPSYIKTKIDRRLKLNYIKYNNIVLFSRVLKHQTDQINSSQFIKELGIQVKKCDGINKEGIFTSMSSYLLLCMEKDRNFDSPCDEYKTYSPKYKKFECSYSKDKYSVTELSEFYQCPFKYYLSKVLNVDEGFEYTTYAALGTMLHAIFEDIYTRNYSSFDQAYKETFEKGKQAFYNHAIKNNHEVTEEEKVTIKMVEKWLPYLIKNEIEHRKSQYSNIESEAYEKPITYSIYDKEADKTYTLTGRVDKIVYSKGSSGQRYYTIIDYKSGTSGSFDITHCFLGGSLQLPIYYLASKQKENYGLTHNNTDEFGGFGIQKIYFKKIPLKDNKTFNSESIQQYMRLNGITNNSKDYLDSFDSTGYNEEGDLNSKSEYIDTKYNFSLNGNSAFTLSKNVTYGVDEFFKDVEKAVIKTIHSAENSDFDISPIAFGKDEDHNSSPCKYCSFKDICYSANKNVLDGNNEYKKHFNLTSSIEDDEEIEDE